VHADPWLKCRNRPHLGDANSNLLSREGIEAPPVRRRGGSSRCGSPRRERSAVVTRRHNVRSRRLRQSQLVLSNSIGIVIGTPGQCRCRQWRGEITPADCPSLRLRGFHSARVPDPRLVWCSYQLRSRQARWRHRPTR
jgi:hypothetical protein